jgi:Zn-dependent peptidase ImmA (M78 family)
MQYSLCHCLAFALANVVSEVRRISFLKKRDDSFCQHDKNEKYVAINTSITYSRRRFC